MHIWLSFTQIKVHNHMNLHNGSGSYTCIFIKTNCQRKFKRFNRSKKMEQIHVRNIRTIQLELVYLNNLRIEYELSNIAEGRKA